MSLLPLDQSESTTYFFNTRELARLAIYRQAITARFYTDECEQPPSQHDLESIRLFDALRSNARAA